MEKSKTKYQVGKMKPDMATFKKRKASKEGAVDAEIRKDKVSKGGSKLIKSILKGR